MAFAPGQTTFEWMGIECPLFDRAYPRVAIPNWNLRDSADVERKKAWEIEEMRRCVHGHGPFCGSYYFYYNYCWIKGNKGIMRPELRMTDNLRFMMEERCKAENTGFVMPKKRRTGATWGAAAIDMHGLLFWAHQCFGYASADEKRSREYLRRLKFVYTRLPAFLKVNMNLVTSTVDQATFGTEETGKNGEQIIHHDSTMLVRAPTEEMWEGFGYGHVRQDEAGKIKMSLSNWLAYTTPILVGDDSITRNGYLSVFGTVGDMEGNAGKEFQKVYEKAESFDLIRFWVPGTFGVRFDAFGNDDLAAAEEMIREKLKKASSKQQEITLRQQYPLTEEDLFLNDKNKFFFDLGTLDAMKDNILKRAPAMVEGSFVMNHTTGKVTFQQRRNGHVEMLEEPELGMKNAYVVGIDPIDNDADDEQGNIVSRFKKNKGHSKDQSDLAFTVRKRKTLLGANHYPVCIFAARLQNVEDAYFQTVCAAIYYDCMINPEWNRQGFIIWCKLTGYTHLLMRGSHRLAQAKRTNSIPEFGYNRDDSTIRTVCEMQKKDLKENWEKQMFGRLEDSYRKFGHENADLCCADGAALLGCAHLDMLEKKATNTVATTRPDGHFLAPLQEVGGIIRWT